MKYRNSESAEGLVYSTDHGRMCPKCNSPVKNCHCTKDKAPPKGDGVVRISRSTKGRKGKGVSVISGLALPHDELTALSKELKQKCGTGGTVKDNCIEIQGDCREKLLQILQSKGFNAKISGG